MNGIQDWDAKRNREREERAAWLAGLKPGDKVAASKYSAWDVLVIERMTATQIIIGRGLKYRRDTGYRIGGNAYSSLPHTIEPITQKILDALEVRKLANWLADLDRKSKSLAVLRAMKAAHDKADAAERGLIEVEVGK